MKTATEPRRPTHSHRLTNAFSMAHGKLGHETNFFEFNGSFEICKIPSRERSIAWKTGDTDSVFVFLNVRSGSEADIRQ